MKTQHQELIVALRHQLHAHPELSLEEHWTKQTLMTFLRTHTSLAVVDRGAWFYAFYQCPLPDASAIAFRADFDAIAITDARNDLPYHSQCPGVSHGCGHDGHSAALCGLALALNAQGAHHDVYLIFQHAEEIGAGGETCAALLTEKNISRVYAMHNLSGYPEGALICRDGLTQCASRGLSFIFHGTACHASQPEDGKNPAFAVAEMIQASRTLLENHTFEGLVLCTVIHAEIGQENFGIAAGEGQLALTLRADREDELARLETLLRTEAQRLALRDGLTWEVSIHDPFPETRNDDAALATVRSAAKALGLKILTLPAPWRASEDFGWYTKRCPGAMFYIGGGKEHPALHTERYDFNDHILATAVDLFLEIEQQTP